MFWSKKPLPVVVKNEELDTIYAKFIKLNAQVSELTAKIDQLDTQFRSLRGKVNLIVAGDYEKPKDSYTFDPSDPLNLKSLRMGT